MKYTATQFYDIYSEDDHVIDQWLNTFYKYDKKFKEVDEWRDIPLSCPWLWRNADKVILHGENIQDMVYNFITDANLYSIVRKEKAPKIYDEAM